MGCGARGSSAGRRTSTSLRPVFSALALSRRSFALSAFCARRTRSSSAASSAFCSRRRPTSDCLSLHSLASALRRHRVAALRSAPASAPEAVAASTAAELMARETAAAAPETASAPSWTAQVAERWSSCGAGRAAIVRTGLAVTGLRATARVEAAAVEGVPAPASPVGGVGARLADLVARGVEAAVLVMSTSGPDVACAQEGRGQRVLVRAGGIVQGGGRGRGGGRATVRAHGGARHGVARRHYH